MSGKANRLSYVFHHLRTSIYVHCNIYKPIKQYEYSPTPNKFCTFVGYNITKDGEVYDRKGFFIALGKTSGGKGVSARDMSLSMGQNPGYINNIESGKSMPSLSGIFYICDYLGISPKDFFDMNANNPQRQRSYILLHKG